MHLRRIAIGLLLLSAGSWAQAAPVKEETAPAQTPPAAAAGVAATPPPTGDPASATAAAPPAAATPLPAMNVRLATPAAGLSKAAQQEARLDAHPLYRKDLTKKVRFEWINLLELRVSW